MNLKWFIYGALFFLAAHVVTWFQLNGQFIWKYFKDNPLILSLVGIPMSYLFILGTKYTVWAFGDLLWPARFVGFGLGIIVYAIFVGIFFQEGITLKTFVSLLISISLIFIQVFWK
jgi:hypothetical protein|tara:strand:- start:11 stop:358 length:348 start_codon:yes stop_codon:yes gene_type:complete